MLHEYEILSLILMEGQNLKAFEKRVPRRIFGSKRKETEV
jgi:hypothetical protein